MKLKRFGFFDEMRESDARWRLEQSRCTEPRPDERKALAYLRGGRQVLAIPGVACDLLSASNEIIGPPHVFTDGEWLWTADVPYYVEHYHIALPAEFVERMIAHGWKCPRVRKIDDLREVVWGMTGTN